MKLQMLGSILALFSIISVAMAANKERTFIMVKPDGVQRGLVGKIIERFEQKGFKLVALKFTWVSDSDNWIIEQNRWRCGAPRGAIFRSNLKGGGTGLGASVIATSGDTLLVLEVKKAIR